MLNSRGSICSEMKGSVCLKSPIEIAFHDKNVKAVIAHTLGIESASTKVLMKCGFMKVDEINDIDDGLIWKWELKRSR